MVRWPAPPVGAPQDGQRVSQVVAMSREPLAAKMFSRAFGSAAPTLTMVSPRASRP